MQFLPRLVAERFQVEVAAAVRTEGERADVSEPLVIEDGEDAILVLPEAPDGPVYVLLSIPLGEQR